MFVTNALLMVSLRSAFGMLILSKHGTLIQTITSILVIGIRPMAPVLNKVHLKVSEQEMLSFSVRKEITKYDNILVVILLSGVVENEFLQPVYNQFLQQNHHITII